MHANPEHSLGEKKAKSSEMVSSPRARSTRGARLAKVRARTSACCSSGLPPLSAAPDDDNDDGESETAIPSTNSRGMGTLGKAAWSCCSSGEVVAAAACIRVAAGRWWRGRGDGRRKAEAPSSRNRKTRRSGPLPAIRVGPPRGMMASGWGWLWLDGACGCAFVCVGSKGSTSSRSLCERAGYTCVLEDFNRARKSNRPNSIKPADAHSPLPA